ncbi:MAG TPA: hypothetical protein VMV44_13860 [Rectinemataceae bacterium]|nr:hypothetical protein [Rectinemataceae bacterium]
MIRKLLVAAILGVALVTSALAVPLSPLDSSPKVDGIVVQGDYAYYADLNGMDFGASLGKDGILSLAIKAPTAGWVAIGLGSGFMDGSWMLMAFEKGGRQEFSEQLGISHFHQRVKETKILAKAVRFEGGMTTLEFQVKATEFLKDGRLPIILAYGRSADFVSYHQRHATTLLTY